MSHPMPATRVDTHRHTQIRTHPSPASTMFRKHHFRRRKGTSYRTRRTVSRRWKGEGGNSKGRKCGLRTLPLHQRTSGHGEGQAPREPVQTAGWGTGRPTAPLPSSGAWWPSKRPKVLEVSAVSVCPRPSRLQCASASSRDAVLPQYGAVRMEKKSGWGQNTAFREARAPSCLWWWLLVTMTFLASPHLSVSGYGGWITIPSARQIREEKTNPVQNHLARLSSLLQPSVSSLHRHTAPHWAFGECACVSLGAPLAGASGSPEEGGLEFF